VFLNPSELFISDWKALLELEYNPVLELPPGENLIGGVLFID
jgi:hypothetical protein